MLCDRAEAYYKLKKHDRAINDLNSAILLTKAAAILIDPINCLAFEIIRELKNLNNSTQEEPSIVHMQPLKSYCQVSGIQKLTVILMHYQMSMI
ncbi:hypothetical protein Glove_476g72 [Diversispora epigaea]|uniref:Uncharacterized protein n=1 Tax=Diversispora epigaea TaxID=1348612 RepID=A0A397GM54_9GLOM|nr:hypothetical protein Glove_476g72 [Diversispora epigaea]